MASICAMPSRAGCARPDSTRTASSTRSITTARGRTIIVAAARGRLLFPARSARSTYERLTAQDLPVTTPISLGPGPRSWISRSCTKRCTPWALCRRVRLITPVRVTPRTTRQTSCGPVTEAGIRQRSTTATTTTSTLTFRDVSTWLTAPTFRAGRHFRRRLRHLHRHRLHHLRHLRRRRRRAAAFRGWWD